jgi:hypothetical protein
MDEEEDTHDRARQAVVVAGEEALIVKKIETIEEETIAKDNIDTHQIEDANANTEMKDAKDIDCIP